MIFRRAREYRGFAFTATGLAEGSPLARFIRILRVTDRRHNALVVRSAVICRSVSADKRLLTEMQYSRRGLSSDRHAHKPLSSRADITYKIQ